MSFTADLLSRDVSLAEIETTHRNASCSASGELWQVCTFDAEHIRPDGACK